MSVKRSVSVPTAIVTKQELAERYRAMKMKKREAADKERDARNSNSAGNARERDEAGELDGTGSPVSDQLPEPSPDA